MIEHTDEDNLKEAAERAAILADGEQERDFAGNDDYPRIVAAEHQPVVHNGFCYKENGKSRPGRIHAG